MSRALAMAVALLAPAARADPAAPDDLGPVDPLDELDDDGLTALDEDRRQDWIAEDEALRARRARVRGPRGASPWPKLSVGLWWDTRPEAGLAREPGRAERLSSDGRARFGWALWALWSAP